MGPGPAAAWLPRAICTWIFRVYISHQGRSKYNHGSSWLLTDIVFSRQSLLPCHLARDSLDYEVHGRNALPAEQMLGAPPACPGEDPTLLCHVRSS